MRANTGTKVTMVILMLVLLAVILYSFFLKEPSINKAENTMTLATTTSTEDSGLLDVIIPVFEKEYKVKVKVLAVGTGQALEIGKRGDADVLLVHDRKAEEEFMAQGYGVNRKNVMHNEFLIVGPAGDPAEIKGMTNAKEAFKKIASKKATFISRGDQSGTHKKELEIWKALGTVPMESWYVEAGQGMGETLMMADEMNAYTLTDEATYLSWREKINLKVMVRGDEVLTNPYGVIAVNPTKYPGVNYQAAMDFIDFVTGPKGQSLIASFGKERYGKPLFTPDANTK